MAAAADYESGHGSIEEVLVFDAYVERILADVKSPRALKVAWDAGNGAMGEAMAAVARRLPGTPILRNAEIDGSFPNPHPDPPVAANLKQLQENVLRAGCELGLALTADGDPLGSADCEAPNHLGCKTLA